MLLGAGTQSNKNGSGRILMKKMELSMVHYSPALRQMEELRHLQVLMFSMKAHLISNIHHKLIESQQAMISSLIMLSMDNG